MEVRARVDPAGGRAAKGLGGPVHCSRCSKAAVVEIRMHIADREVTFRRCHRCEEQSWETPDGPVALTHVLDLARAG
jgi:hypothetical protein